MKNKKRITLDVTPEFYDRMETLQATMGEVTKAQMVCLSLQLLEYVAKQRADGVQFFERDSDGRLREVVFIGL